MRAQGLTRIPCHWQLHVGGQTDATFTNHLYLRYVMDVNKKLGSGAGSPS